MHGDDLSRELRQLRRRLNDYLAELAAADGRVPLMVGERGQRYPAPQFAIDFGSWLRARASNRASHGPMLALALPVPAEPCYGPCLEPGRLGPAAGACLEGRPS